MTWPSVAPDLNSVCHVWFLLVREVYSSEKQYVTDSELKAVKMSHWEEIDQKTLRGFSRFLPVRDFTLI